VRGKLVFWQITFDAKTLFAFFIEDEDRWGPDNLKAMEGGRILLDMNSGGEEVFFDEVGQFLIGV
jgi:hypothetical protein